MTEYDARPPETATRRFAVAADQRAVLKPLTETGIADLVVLSACRTGVGRQVRGEGLLGLTRGFMYAGAPRVVSTLWDVRDEQTSELMARFYREMLRGGALESELVSGTNPFIGREKLTTTPEAERECDSRSAASELISNLRSTARRFDHGVVSEQIPLDLLGVDLLATLVHDLVERLLDLLLGGADLGQ